MPTSDSLLDAKPTPPSSSVAAEAAPPNLALAVLRRWPWLVLGLGVGLVLGFLYHLQRPPVYQSSAELMVVKNRPEMLTTGPDARVQYLEDYVAPQVILLGSESILKIAAEKRLDEQKPFQVPPPEPTAERIDFLRRHFQVTREKEPGSNVPSNVLLLTFKSAHPADAPKYLRAIIAAYRDELSGVYEDATVRQLRQLDEEIARLNKTMGDTRTAIAELERKLRGVVDPATGVLQVPGISQEDLSSIRQRIAANKATETNLRLREPVIARELAEIRSAGTTRAQRLAVMAKLGVPAEQVGLVGDLRDPDTLLIALRNKQAELGVRLGPGHPEMIALANQIRTIEAEIQRRGGPPDDELERYRKKLENEQTAITEQLKVLAERIADDEDKARRMAPLQQAIEANQAALARDTERLREAIREKERVSGTRNAGGFEVRDVSRPSDGVQVAPVLLQSLALGVVVGLLLGAGLALWVELSDRSFRSPADIRRHLGLPVLGHVPLIRTGDAPEVKPIAQLDPSLVAYLRPHSLEAEAVRGIRTQVLFSTQNRTHQVIQITSPNSGDGKSTLAANLAVSLAATDKRVVLVDCDFRRPRLHRLFDLPSSEVGLTSVVTDAADLGAAVQACEVPNLSLLPCGPRPANPAELLSGPKFLEVLNDLRSSYDFVILDTPPILAVTDPAVVATRADAVILVFRMTSDARPAAEQARDELLAVQVQPLGVVVNASSERDMGYGFGYAYRYGSKYTAEYAEKKVYADKKEYADKKA